MQRRKGHDFERKIAALFRQHWPDAVVRRASQAERADNADVFVEGGPPILARLWLELQHARKPTPFAKLQQAEGDIACWRSRRAVTTSARLPVVVWHRTGDRSADAYVTMRLGVLDFLRFGDRRDVWCHNELVTVSFDAFVEVLAHNARWWPALATEAA
jgi:hypothetical protein